MSKGFRSTFKTFNSEVTGSCLMIKNKRPGEQYERIVVDAGGFNEKQYEDLNSKLDFDPSDVSHLILTHAHYDHIYKTPYFVKNGYKGEIYCSPASKELIKIALNDSLRIMQSEHDKYGKEMLYSKENVEQTISQLRGIEYNLPTHISKGIKVTFLGNGHLFGAVCVLMQISCKKYEDKNILITGDYYPNNELFDIPCIPEWVKRLPNLTIIQESTYGNVSVNDVNYCFENYVTSSLNNGKNILLPVISLERLEIVLNKLKFMQEEETLNSSVKIFIHTELGRQYLENVYLSSRNIKEFMPKNVEILSKDDYETALKYPFNKIIISSSGMADKGTVRFYLKNILQNKNYSIIFTCYTEKSTLGHKLRTMQKGDTVRIDDLDLALLCDVKHTGEFSRHVKFEQILDFINQFDSVKNILLTHGTTNTKEQLLKKLSCVYPDKDICVMCREVGFKLDKELNISTYTPTYYSMSKKDKKLKVRKCKGNSKCGNNNSELYT